MDSIKFSRSQFKDIKIALFGDLMIDEYLNGDVSRVSPEAPVPIVRIKSDLRRPGGAGNVALNICTLEAKVRVISFIGNDMGGDWLLEKFSERGIDITGIMRGDDMVTSVKTRVTSQNQQLLRYDCEIIKEIPQKFLAFLKQNSDQLLSTCNAVLISDYGKGVVTKESAKIVIESAKRIGIPVIVDPKGTDYSKYYGATACTPNMKELQGAVGRELGTEEEIAAAGKELCTKCDLKFVLATRSEKGMSLINCDGNKKDYPALAKEVSDVTGAGDTVISVFTLCNALGFPHDYSCALSNMAASIVVSKFGAATVSPEELEKIIGEQKDNNKILSWEQAKEKAITFHKQGKKIVFTNGCFDLVHAGHISSFKQSREQGDVLFVGVNSDASIHRIKGEKRPIVDEKNRLMLLAAIEYIDYVILFEDDTPEELIRLVRPDVLVKGRDWEGKPVAGSDFVVQNGGKLFFIDLEDGLSTTNIINKILEGNEVQ